MKNGLGLQPKRSLRIIRVLASVIIGYSQTFLSSKQAYASPAAFLKNVGRRLRIA